MTSIRRQAAPDLSNQPKFSIFNQNDFNAAIWGEGYDVILERAINCPCKGVNPDSKPSCNNCHGLGWVFVDAVQTKAFIQSINKNTKYKDWSPELVGTISITFMSNNRFGLMDKISLINNTSMMSEVLRVRNYNSNRFVFCTYKPKLIKDIYFYVSDTESLIKLDVEDYVISSKNPFIIYIRPDIMINSSNSYISVYYEHNITYNIIDIPHDMRITKEYDNNGKKSQADMPMQAIARKSQYELGVNTNLEGDNLINNKPEGVNEEDFNNDFSKGDYNS